MPVQTARRELTELMPRYRKIRDCLIGSEAVKGAGDKYLPRPDPSNTSKENRLRYESYKSRAVFYNATQRTAFGMVGQVTIRPPVREVPNALDALVNDASGGGVSLDQSSTKSLLFTVTYGRSGLLVDFPQTPGPLSIADKESGKYRPNILTFGPEQVINWRTIAVGAEQRLALVVIAEEWPYFDDGFERKTACQFRVLQLDKDMNYVVNIWREDQPSNWTIGANLPPSSRRYSIQETYMPTGPDGNYLNEIPFMFIGSQNNDENIDNPPIMDLVELNLAHYRNSADYEEAVYMLGQPTYWISGLDKDWVENVMGGVVRLGAMGGIPLPPNAQAGLLQPEPNTMAKEAMDQKENQMTAIGARLVQQKTVQRTATEAGHDHEVQSSVLSACAKNVSAAYVWALRWAAYFNGDISDRDADQTIKYELNSDYEMMQLDAATVQAIVKTWQSGGITFGELRAILRKSGIATLDDEQASDEIAKEQAEQMAAAAKAMNQSGQPPSNQPSET